MSGDLPPRRYRAGDWLDDLCRQCKTTRRHTVQVADGAGNVLRVICDFCSSTHNFRGGERGEPRGTERPPGVSARPADEPLVSPRERSFPPMSAEGIDLELMLRRVIREEIGLTAVTPADKWRGGELVLRPGKPGLQDKSVPIDTFFNKVVMLRNRLRTLEQHVNAADLPQELKVKLQGYITGCYGSLTSFNVLFADEDDKFVGSGGE
jgi:hypothetical protein